jgi:hypothetical protein
MTKEEVRSIKLAPQSMGMGQVTVAIPDPPLVELAYPVKVRMDAWADMAPEEISGIGTIHEEVRDGRLHIRVTNLWLLEQRCTAVQTTIKFADIARFMMKMPPGIRDQDLRFWWHSHVNMEARWSGTDLATHRQLSGTGTNFLSIVSNRRGDMMAKYTIGSPMIMGFDGLPIVVTGHDETILKAAAEEFQGKVADLPKGFSVKIQDGRVLTGSQTTWPGGDECTRESDEEGTEKSDLTPSSLLRNS